jgi:photosystem II stability/assembly factor-like uncharacterized protein
VSFPSNGQTGYIGAQSPAESARVFKTTDAGSSWITVSVGGPASVSRGCAMADDSNGVAFGLGGFLWGTTDGFATGKSLDPNTDANIAAGAFSRGDPNRAFIVGTDTELAIGVIRYASTGSQQGVWDSVRCPVDPSFSCVDYPSPETAWVGGAWGFIGETYNAHDVWKTNTGVTNQICSICFPHDSDTGYAAAGPIILKTTDGGQPWIPAVAEGKSPVAVRAGIRVLSNPSRRGITFHADADVSVAVFDAAGRVVARQAATKGLNFLPLSKAGAYLIREQGSRGRGFEDSRVAKVIISR